MLALLLALLRLDGGGAMDPNGVLLSDGVLLGEG